MFFSFICKSTDTLIEQTNIKPRETIDFKITESKKSFPIDLPLQKGDNSSNSEQRWMRGLKVSESLFAITIKES